MTSEELAAALELCNSEPVHTPGLIQPCGTVLAYDLSTRHISHISSNIAEVLGVEREARAFLGQPLEVLFDGDMRHALRNCEARPASELRRDYVGRYYLGQKDFDLYGFRSDGHMVLELEAADGADMDAAALSTRLSDLNDACSHADSEAALWQQLVRVLQQVSGYDRVLAYRFDADFNGEVIAEACRRSMVPLLGLRFPHWDIPPQARAIMAKTPLRFIADVDLEPAAVLAAGPDLPPLDISLGHLRGVSPVHLQYLRNLGSQATLTLSVVLDGRLWGMLSFHHRKPRVPSLALRHLLTSFLPNMQTRLEVLARKRDLDIASRVQTLREQAHAALSAPGTADLAFSELAPLILADLKADGVVLRVGGETYALGDVPPPRVVSVLVGQALRDETGPLALHQLDDALRQHADGPAGALVVAYGRDRAMAVFRNPVSQEVAWAGAPQKELDHSDGTLRLSPRGSFDTYLELVEGQSIRWSAFECQLAPALTQSFLSAFEFRAAAQAFGEQQFLMLNELNHRVKNILALMRWMAKGGRRDNKTLSSYADALQNRIITVARAFDQGAGSGDRWVALNGLLQAEFTADEAVSLPQTGLDIRASAAPLLAMVLHELASNARTHGALSEAGDVILGVVARDSHYRLLWQEMGGPAVASAGEIIEGFGLTLIRQAIPFELGGQAEVAFMASGLRARFWICPRICCAPVSPIQTVKQMTTVGRPATVGPRMGPIGWCPLRLCGQRIGCSLRCMSCLRGCARRARSACWSRIIL